MSDKYFITKEKIINAEKGNIHHLIKQSSDGFTGFGEAYLSSVQKNLVKGWKKHQLMTLNLCVIFGCIRFVIYDESYENFDVILIDSQDNKRLTIKPETWLAFQAVNKDSLILNIADIPHDPNEHVNKPIEAFNFNWSIK